MRAWHHASEALLAQRGRLFGWVPVCLGTGIGWYFSRWDEPGTALWWAAGGVAVALALLSRRVPYAVAPLLLALVLVIVGAGLAKWRTEAVAGPVLGFRYYGPIEGRVVGFDRSAGDAPRLTLDRVVLSRMAPDRTPLRVRISLYGDQPLTDIAPGDRLILTGHLSPPAGPAEPGGFDFQRFAWFDRLGAVGYTRTPVLRFARAPDTGAGLAVVRARMALSAAVQAAMPGERGAFAAAILSGDRAGMSQETLQALRASNLAHLLAISGLHMGLLTGTIYTALRVAGAAVPALALRLPVKKIAAAFAMLAGFGYLLLSGGNVATERAFIMVSVMFAGVMLDRRALTLRGVAIAAVIVLVLHPDALGGPGFQMSFAATVALIVVFNAAKRWPKGPRLLRPVLATFLSSLVAGLATAPYAAAHFNQIAHYGLLANLAAVPIFGAVVMPAAVLAVCLAPFGLFGWGLALMDLGIRWILFVAHFAAGQEGALSHVPAPPPAMLPLLTLGALWLILWQGRLRWAGLVGVLAAAVIWAGATRPALLIADDGNLIGQMTDAGRVLSREKGSGFVAGIWLENDGAPVAQEVAFARPGLSAAGKLIRADLGGWEVLQVGGKTALAGLTGCDGADVLVSNQVDAGARPCLVLDVARLRLTGAVALDLTDTGALALTSVRSRAGQRPWNRQPGTDPLARAKPLVLTRAPAD